MPKYIIILVVSWVIAQGAKYILEISKDRKASFKRIITESGGMPSSHSAVVIAIATYTGFEYGIHSAIFGLALVFALIVIYDSMKVRYSVGLQAEAINEMINQQRIKINHIRVVKGHTPLEVAVGTALGFFIGFISFLIR